MTRSLYLTQDAEADALLGRDPLALLLGMLLDQQITMEKAFTGPKTLAERLGGLDVHRIATMDQEEFLAVCAQPPAIHRFPGSMGKRVQTLCQYLVDEYEGEVERIWQEGDPSGREVLKRLKALPGFGDQKARIFVALLGKQWDVRPEGWREAAGAYGEDGVRMSIADVVDQQSLEEVRTWKKQQKAAAKK
ncbi:putative HhH-GPD family protein [Saccharopolyspora erythraea NRRL 2338]|uniref:HhH-GPD n=2 Tax=Saccharopolyspora erythraea TaxID=1836 RepID=A4FAN1_SACEN|nr:HhH-GPD-type base excision DNA repair protein [Saccharopolyspora erythraea]EQD82510.1 iron-sulfur cluster assembly protein HesB [Saccharopolyspora erythraea D]PFG94891.1 putative HhH-GPD family protein [Saccharopolyspora erythraea NRRL 2338]QRK91593.1 Fe-S cluster assembly protein HesB [Saccharopolyspora erythraea]CAM01106.1 HhH-GPD [Saccharopolyspora erythraea NRRL 2338]